MSKLIYWLLISLSFVLGFTGIFIAGAGDVGENLRTVASTFAGAAFGLAANIFVQKIASSEQTDLMRAITMEAEGVCPLPDSFFNLSNIAHATKKAINSEEKEVFWVCTELTKIGGSGKRFVTYSNTLKNLMGNSVTYHLTFIGSQSCVICIITKEHETASVVTFDTKIPSAGIHFGTAYLTDWAGDRDLTLMLISAQKIEGNDLNNLPENAVAAFHHWYQSIDIQIEKAYSAFPKNNAVRM